jgi:transposase
MLLSSVFKTFLLREIDASNHTKIKGRPIILQEDEEALNCIFKVLRTGMQWREIQSSVSYATVFRRFQQWTNKDIFRKAYKKALLTYKTKTSLWC